MKSTLNKLKRFVLVSHLCFYHTFAFCQTADTLTPPKTYKQFILPASLLAGGLLVQGTISRNVRDEIIKSYPTFHTEADDIIQYMPFGLMFGLDAVGLKGKHKLGDQLVLSVLSTALSQGITQSLKYTIKYPRPDADGNESFPSGHTTMAFTSATILHHEFGEKSVAISILGYSAATTTGAMRMLNKRHWLADVLFGAGVGIASTHAVYAVYPWLKRKVFKRNKMVALPTYSAQNGGGVYVWMQF